MKSNTATRFCKLCFQPIEGASFGVLLNEKVSLCLRCYNSFAPKMIRFPTNGIPTYSLFPYNEAFRNALYRFKGCGDIELASIFTCRLSFILPLLFPGYVIVPVPSSPGHDEKRGFNQVEEIAKTIPLPFVNALSKPFEHKQSDMSAEMRRKVKQFLRLTHPERIRGKKVLLLDDVYTTGSTCAACLDLLKKGGAKKTKALVLAKVSKKQGEGFP